jgi:TPR repeat protein
MGVLCLDTDMSEAFNWFNQVFETHTSPKYNWDDRAEGKDINIYAQYNLGVMYDNGLGVPTDKKKAFNYYLASADLNFYNNSVSVFRTGQGFYMSDNNLGVMYAEGELNTGINMDKARKRIKHALETNMSDSGIPLANWQKYKFDN